MAHTNETVNYHLSQFVGTDIPNPLVDYNGDMEKIDTAIKNVADNAVSQTSRIVALETQNGNTPLTTTSQTISGAVNELDSEIGGIDTRVTTAEEKIVEDETTLGTAVNNISTLSGKVSGLETKVGSAVLTTVASDCSGAINELDGEVGTLANLTTTAKNNVVSAVNEVDAGVTALETQNGSAVLTTTAQTLSGAVNELNAKASRTLRKRIIGDGVKTTSDLLNELYTTFAGLTDAELSSAALLTTQSSGKSNFIYQGGSLTSFILARTTSSGNVVMEAKETGSTSILYKLDGTTQDYSANVIPEGYTYSIYA